MEIEIGGVPGQLTGSARLEGDTEKVAAKGRGRAALGGLASGAHPAERGTSRKYWPFSRQSMPVRQPEAQRTRSRNSFGSANMGKFELTLLRGCAARW